MTIYEVLRIEEKKPMFLKQHIDRLNNSLRAKSCEKVEDVYIEEKIKELIDEQDTGNFNCRIEVIYEDETKKEREIKVFRNPHFYPTEEMYAKGVETAVFEIERANPNVKEAKQAYVEAVAKEKEEKDVFELLIANQKGQITEGSKSNVFFIMDERVFTASSEYVLEGVTRATALQAIENEGLELVYHLVTKEDLSYVEAAFLTGTSLNILPINKIDDIEVKTVENSTYKRINEQYKKLYAKEKER